MKQFVCVIISLYMWLEQLASKTVTFFHSIFKVSEKTETYTFV